jgi:hypothetical protein
MLLDRYAISRMLDLSGMFCIAPLPYAVACPRHRVYHFTRPHGTYPGSGLIGGGSYGFVTGWAQARKVGHTKLKLNSALNASGRIGGRLGNGFAVFGNQILFFPSYLSFPPSLALTLYHFDLFLFLPLYVSLFLSSRI